MAEKNFEEMAFGTIRLMVETGEAAFEKFPEKDYHHVLLRKEDIRYLRYIFDKAAS